MARLTVQSDGNVGVGLVRPTAKLHVAGNVKVNTLGAAGATPLCRNASNEIATCTAPAAPTESGAAAAAASPEQQEQIESQRREIEAQRRRIEELEQRLRALESLLVERGGAPSRGGRP